MRNLALELARTVHHDGKDGVIDDIETGQGFGEWLESQGLRPSRAREKVVELRRAIRALFAHAVHPDPPAKDDDGRLSLDIALRQLNKAATGVLRAPQLVWPDEVEYRETFADESHQLLAEIARSAIDVLSGPDRKRLKACPAPRCVKYFLQAHPRQAWCKPSCGNRARVGRYYQRHHDVSTGSDSTP
ncbi:CGNR zinc finger domain-containing protein [Actinocrispum sp. NPDC049592]|uniref:CGNR zinc finger domain-containing protein n=1 Tax=Actinocrispum sp. NPDC049592 TaxID=3154835 RepID=UPI0034215978